MSNAIYNFPLIKKLSSFISFFLLNDLTFICSRKYKRLTTYTITLKKIKLLSHLRFIYKLILIKHLNTNIYTNKIWHIYIKLTLKHTDAMWHVIHLCSLKICNQTKLIILRWCCPVLWKVAWIDRWMEGRMDEWMFGLTDQLAVRFSVFLDRLVGLVCWLYIFFSGIWCHLYIWQNVYMCNLRVIHYSQR